MEQNWEYQVALSFAGEQREYVEKVSKELTNLGIKHFYDNANKADLWGKNLTKHLDEIYYSKSRYVVAFISQEYKDKIWTNWEMSSAQDRALRDKNEYILPVYFEEIRLPGLVSSIGHIDARHTTPKELAQLIHAKITDGLSQIKPKNSNYQFYSPALFQIELHQLEKTKLQLAFEDCERSSATVVCGEKGVGKRTTIGSFLSGKKNVVHIVPNSEPHYQFEAIVNAIDNSKAVFSSKDDLSVPERIKNRILDLCRESKKILYFENMDQYNMGLIRFIFEFCKNILLYHPEYKTFIIFEYDSDGAINLDKQFYSFPPVSLTFIRFKRVEQETLKRYLKETLGSIAISEADATYIICAAHGNVMYLNTILNYLNMKGFIDNTTQLCTCTHLTDGELADVLGEYIQERYDRLDYSLKDVLNKSAIIGNTFSSHLLSNPFRIIHAEEMLNKIEAISKLIKHEDQEQYSFESFDSFRIVCNAIHPDESCKWHHILGEYFIHRFERMQKGHNHISTDQRIYHLHTAINHFRLAGDYRECVSHINELIEAYLEISDYESAQKMISEARKIIDELEDDELTDPELDKRIDLFDARCLSEMGQFAKASELYKDYINTPSLKTDYKSLARIKLACALCYYMDSKPTTAIKLAEETESELRTIAPNSTMYCDALSLLASFHDSTGEVQKKKGYYIKAITLSRKNGFENEYYHLLKMASMVYDENIAIEMYLPALEYFESHHQKKNVAELHHNIATDLLYLCRQTEIVQHLTMSINAFSSFGSLMIVYPLNTKGIFTAIFEKDYKKASEVFESALQYESEPYTKVVLKANLTSCFLKTNQPNNAYLQLLEIDRIISKPESRNIYDFHIYQLLTWGQYYYYVNDFSKCIGLLTKCSKIPHLEARFIYMCEFLIHLAKKQLGKNARKPRQHAPKPILDHYYKEECVFFSLRFYE